ncbi:hypothetical protein KY284_021016 [Solanum tuberosum]|nr:hypothetical protein KY284_021016 [Solanum tuberosum]
MRNTVLYGGKVSMNKIIRHIDDLIKKFIWSRFNLIAGNKGWCDIIQLLESCHPKISYKIVRWSAPSPKWLKCNTDGASRGNPGPSSAAFCIRNLRGEIIVAKGFLLPNTTNMVAEARAIREGLMYFRDKKLNYIVIETDSLAMVQILEGKWETPWNVQ